MTLALIGAGLGRTGTSSLRDALNSLGYPCYHMTELALNPDRRDDVDFWAEVPRGPTTDRPDWEGFFDGYRAILDFPGCFFWRELMAVYPEAKVVLTLHPKGPEAWYDSTYETIYVKAESANASAFGRRFNEVVDRHVWTGFFGGRFEDRDEAIARYEAHNRAVMDGVPEDRLVVFSADQGWDPICAALGEDVPDRPFPRSNERAEMARRMARLERMKAFRLRDQERNGTDG